MQLALRMGPHQAIELVNTLAAVRGAGFVRRADQAVSVQNCSLLLVATPLPTSLALMYVPPTAFGAVSGTCRGPDVFSGSVDAVGRHRT
jgi:hypothetical protein